MADGCLDGFFIGLPYEFKIKYEIISNSMSSRFSTPKIKSSKIDITIRNSWFATLC